MEFCIREDFIFYIPGYSFLEHCLLFASEQFAICSEIFCFLTIAKIKANIVGGGRRKKDKERDLKR